MTEVGRAIRKELRRSSAAETASGLGGTKEFPEKFLASCDPLIVRSAGYSERYRIWRILWLEEWLLSDHVSYQMRRKRCIRIWPYCGRGQIVKQSDGSVARLRILP